MAPAPSRAAAPLVMKLPRPSSLPPVAAVLAAVLAASWTSPALASPISTPTPLAGPQGALSSPRGYDMPGPGDVGEGGPGDRGGTSVTDSASWTRWWTFNREPFLAEIRSPGAGAVRAAELGVPEQRAFLAGVDPGRVYTEVVPLLKEHLAATKDLDLALGCVLALGKIGEAPRDLARAKDLEPIAPAILARLEDSNEKVRDAAVLALGLVGDPRQVPLLASIVKDTKEGRAALGRGKIDHRTRAFGAYALGLVGHSSHRLSERTFVVGHLLELAETERGDTELAAAAIVSLGWAPLPMEPRGTEDEARGQEDLVERLMALFEDDDTDLRARAQAPAAVARLLRYSPPDGAAHEAPELTAARERLRLAALVRFAAGLAERGGERNASVREGLAQALGLVAKPRADGPDRDAIEALLEVADSGQEREAGLAVVALARIAAVGAADRAGVRADVVKEIRAALAQNLTEGSMGQRPWSVLALGLLDRLGQERGAPVALGTRALLADRMKSGSSPEERAAAAIALGLAGDQEVVGRLTGALHQGDFAIRGLCAMALALIGAEGALEPLREIAAENVYRPQLLRDTATALALLGDEQLVELLVQKLARARFMPERIAALKALAWSEDHGAIPALMFVLREKRIGRRKIDDTSRAFAAAALGALCSKEPLPWNSHLALDITWSAAPPSLTDEDDGGGVLDLF